MVKHITDDEVQMYVVERQQCDIRIVEHVHACKECKLKVEIYQSLITGIKQATKRIAKTSNQVPTPGLFRSPGRTPANLIR